MTFLLQYWKVDWKRFGGPAFFGSSIASAIMLLVMAQTTNVFVAYAMYLSTSSMYHILIAVARYAFWTVDLPALQLLEHVPKDMF